MWRFNNKISWHCSLTLVEVIVEIPLTTAYCHDAPLNLWDEFLWIPEWGLHQNDPKKPSVYGLEVFFLFVLFWDTWGMLVPGVPWGIFLDGKIQDRKKPPGLSANITTMHHKKWLKKELGARCKDHGPTRCDFRVYKNKSNTPSQILFKHIVCWCILSIISTCINNPILTPFPHQESTDFLRRLELRRNMSQPQVIPTHS